MTALVLFNRPLPRSSIVSRRWTRTSANREGHAASDWSYCVWKTPLLSMIELASNRLPK